MGILERIRTVLKANINALISKAEDPEKMLNQLVMDMNEQLIEAKTQADEWERKAMLAVKAGKDDLAKEALVRKQEYEGYAASFQKEYDAQHTSVEQLKDALRQLQAKIEEAGRKKNLLIARAKRAEAQKQIQQTMGTLGSGSSFDTFDRMTAKVDQLEAEADAAGELASISADQKLEDKFKELESSGDSADKLLEDLKAKMGKLEDKK